MINQLRLYTEVKWFSIGITLQKLVKLHGLTIVLLTSMNSASFFFLKNKFHHFYLADLYSKLTMHRPTCKEKM